MTMERVIRKYLNEKCPKVFDFLKVKGFDFWNR